MFFFAAPSILQSNFTVVHTDYETFAVISNCDLETEDDFTQYTKYATLWSRTRELTDNFVDKVMS